MRVALTLDQDQFQFYFLPPATKLGQGYIFTGVCDSVHGGGEYLGRYTPRDQVPPRPGTPPGPDTPPRAVHAGRYGQQAGGTHPTGMHSCCLRNNQYFSNCILHVVFFYFRILARIHSCHHAIYKASTSK